MFTLFYTFSLDYITYSKTTFSDSLLLLLLLRVNLHWLGAQHNHIALGIPWWSSGWDSVLSLLGPGSILGWKTKPLQAKDEKQIIIKLKMERTWQETWKEGSREGGRNGGREEERKR